jgi:hypothetical protein
MKENTLPVAALVPGRQKSNSANLSTFEKGTWVEMVSHFNKNHL